MLAVTAQGLDRLIQAMIGKFPASVERARLSALKSTGYLVKQHVENHIGYGGSGWAPLSDWGRTWKKSKAKGWTKTRRLSPLLGLQRFVRYRLSRDQQAVVVGLGKSRRGEPGKLDKFLSGLARRHEYGETIPVTDQMRLKVAGTKKRSGKRSKVGPGGPMALRASTEEINIPARPIFRPVFRRTENSLQSHLRAKFFEALNRYAS